MQSPFVGHHQDFLKIVGEDSRIRVIAQDPEGRSLYHEAGEHVTRAEQNRKLTELGRTRCLGAFYRTSLHY